MHDCLENISSNSLEKYFQTKTELDADTQTASLIVQDVPNPPNLQWVECNSKDASVVWVPRGDNRAPILTYKIQYNTTFLSDTWETAAGLTIKL